MAEDSWLSRQPTTPGVLSCAGHQLEGESKSTPRASRRRHLACYPVPGISWKENRSRHPGPLCLPRDSPGPLRCRPTRPALQTTQPKKLTNQKTTGTKCLSTYVGCSRSRATLEQMRVSICGSAKKYRDRDRDRDPNVPDRDSLRRTWY